MTRKFAFVSSYLDTEKERDLVIPYRATAGSAGYDFFLPCNVTIKAHSCSGIIPSGIKVYMEKDDYLGLTIRSSLAMKGIRIPQGEAIIDADYVDNPTNEGEIGLAFYNDSNENITLAKGTRCAQGIFKKYLITDFDLPAPDIRTGGFGSTGA